MNTSLRNLALLTTILVSAAAMSRFAAGQETESEGVPSYLQPDNESEDLNLPSAPSGHAGRVNNQVPPKYLSSVGHIITP